MARGTHLRIGPAELFGGEIRPVRIEAASARGRVAHHAVLLTVTTDTALESLTRGGAVACGEGRVPVMVYGLPADEAATGRDAVLRVTGLAELAGIVAVGARGRPAISLHWMPGGEIRRVIGSLGAGVGTVALEALFLDVAAGAGLW